MSTIHTLFQFIFGIQVFFINLSVRNYLKIARFSWRRYVLRKPVPFAVVFALTYKCQCNCIHCFIGDYKKRENDMSTEEIKSILNFIDRWGPIKITFFGGEPLLREDIVQLVTFASKKGLRVSIDTNGILLSENLVRELKRAGVANINVSIDSANEFMHDSLRQKKGCFQSAVTGLILCTKYKIPCLISTYGSKRAIAEKDLEKIIKLARHLGVNGVKILFPILSGKWRDSESERLTHSEEEYVKGLLDPSFVYIEDALEMMHKKWGGCSAMERNLVYISPYGDIQPCAAIPVTFGNICDEGICSVFKRMSGHVFFKKFKSCRQCLMNDGHFRDAYYFNKKRRELPLDVREFEL